MHGRAIRTLEVSGGVERRTAALLKKCGLKLRVVPSGGDVRVTAPKGRRKSTGTMLCAGGWIDCRTAQDMAERLGVPAVRLGRLLDALEIKVRKCELGCF